jgi:CheY-like chemotaxis protein
MRCLLVDDEPGIREGLAALLRRKGHEVVTAGDGAAAQQALAAGGFDVVVTDWRLPDGTAQRFLLDCRVPVVAISGHPEEVDAEVAQVLTKPVAPAHLLAVLTELTAGGVPSAPAASVAQVVAALPADVRRLVETFQSLVGGECSDDGAFVVLQAELADSGHLPALQRLGGDLQLLSRDGRRHVRLRLYRDGRPEVGMPVVAADAPRSHGRGHELPMQAKVGPRLPALYADLWSNP